MGMEIERDIARAQEGDTVAYGRVVEEFQGPLRAYAAAFCPDRDQLNEIAQRTFVWAYEHLHEYAPGTRFQAWLKSIARNHLLSELEIQKREAAGRRKYLEHIQIVHSRGSLEVEGRDLSAALRGCIEALPNHARTLIRDRYEGEKSVEHLAQALGRKTGAVKVTLFRIRQALRRCVEGKSAALGDLA